MKFLKGAAPVATTASAAAGFLRASCCTTDGSWRSEFSPPPPGPGIREIPDDPLASRRWRYIGLGGVHARSTLLSCIILVALIPPVAAADVPPRAPAASLTLPATPPKRGFSVERTLNNLGFDQPVAIVAPPGETSRLFIVEKPGRIRVIANLANPVATTFLDITSRVGTSSGEQGLLALSFHPDYAANRFFYVWHTLSTTSPAGSGRHDRLARYTVSPENPNIADAASETPLITQRDEAANHNGGELLFGPDGYLYVSLGDEGGGNDQFANGQRIDRDFFSAVLRLDVDRRPGSLEPNPHPAMHAGTYSIPPDNPFIGFTAFSGRAFSASAVRTEIWATGLRNPWRMSLDPSNGRIWIGDVGQGAREEVDVLARGGNYGWPHREGFLTGPGGPAPAGTGFVDPVHDYPRSQGQSITGGIVHRGGVLSQLYGAYLFADYASGRIWLLRENASAPPIVEHIATAPGIVSFAAHPATGDILLADIGGGAILRLVYDNSSTGPDLPAMLSATGAFADLQTLTPATGLVPYEPNVSFWFDHAEKRRWFALPDTTSVFGFSNEGNWTLPSGTVWVKHFDLEMTRGDSASARRIETRFLIKTNEGIYGLTYRWNDAQTDATLVPDQGAEQEFIILEQGVARTQTWRFPSRGECLQCHTSQGGYALSFNARQLNRTLAYPSGSANQLRALEQAGYFSGPISPPEALPALAAADDLTAELQHRARSYLDVNCSMCHQPGGPALGGWDARIRTPLSIADIVDGALVDQAGDAANRVLAPGDPARSSLLQRIQGIHAPRMPPIATRERDLAGEALLEAWIMELALPSLRPRLVNLSGRAHVGTGQDILIPSFVIEGTEPKTVLVRAIGPGLRDFGVADPLSAPVLTVFSGPDAVATNAGWHTAVNAGAIREAAPLLGAFPLSETAADSALLIDLPPGAYTAQTAGAATATGEALVEVYDAQPHSISNRLVNTALRARIGAGDVLITGLVVREGGPAGILARAIGPGLAEFGVTERIARPFLRMLRNGDEVASNVVWRTSANASSTQRAAQSVGAFALGADSDDAALLLNLAPGVYTLHTGADDGRAGIVLVEVYEVR